MRQLAALSLFLGLCLASAAAPWWCAEAAEKPNIILIMADDLGYGDVGFNGNNIIKTPHLDEMANNGIVFNRFYAGAAVCSPTRGSCLTGRHPYRYGIFTASAGYLPSEEITIARIC